MTWTTVLAASVISIYMGGVPLIYNGQEVGVTDNIPFFSNSPINWALNPDMLESYKNLLEFYATSEVVKKGELVTFNHPTVVAFTRTQGTDAVLVIVNTRNENTSYTLPDELVNTNWINALSGNAMNFNTEIEMSPYEYIILKNN